MTTTISIPEGTIVGRMTGDKVTPVTLLGTVYAEAYRDYDGSWIYSVGKQQYCCAGGLAIVEGFDDEINEQGFTWDRDGAV